MSKHSRDVVQTCSEVKPTHTGSSQCNAVNPNSKQIAFHENIIELAFKMPSIKDDKQECVI